MNSYEPFVEFAQWADIEVGNVWNEFLQALNYASRSATPSDLQTAIDMALRSAALESGAIEGLYSTTRGLTRTVALQGAMWEAELERLGSDVRGHFEAQLAAFDLVLDVATKTSPLSEAWLRQLHAKACAAQATYTVLTPTGWQEQPFPHGKYKTSPNNVIQRDGTTHWYAPEADVPAEMHRLVEEMRTVAFGNAHPVIQASFAHHALTAVHPFADGNGRVARALASVFLYRAAGIPLIIFSDQQEQYWDMLADADADRRQSFVTFIDDRALDTMAMIRDRLREVRSPLEGTAEAIRARFQAHGGLSHSEVQIMGQRLTGHIQQVISHQFNSQSFTSDVQGIFEGRSGSDPSSFWGNPYRPLLSGAYKFRVVCNDPVNVNTFTFPLVGLSNDVSNHFPFMVIDASRRGEVEPLRLRISDLDPSISAATEIRIEGWVRYLLSVVLHEFNNGVENALKRATGSI